MYEEDVTPVAYYSLLYQTAPTQREQYIVLSPSSTLLGRYKLQVAYDRAPSPWLLGRN